MGITDNWNIKLVLFGKALSMPKAVPIKLLEPTEARGIHRL